MSLLFAHHSLLGALPRSSAVELLAHLELVELRRGALPLLLQGCEQVYLPLSATIAIESVQSEGASAYQVFFRGHHICGLERIVLPNLSQRMTVVGAGYALRGQLKEIAALLIKLDVAKTLVPATLRGMAEVHSHNAACASSHTTSQRLARLLIEAQRSFGDGNAVTLSHQQLAVFLGTRRETISGIVKTHTTGKLARSRHARGIVSDTAILQQSACPCWAHSAASLDRYLQALSALSTESVDD